MSINDDSIRPPRERTLPGIGLARRLTALGIPREASALYAATVSSARIRFIDLTFAKKCRASAEALSDAISFINEDSRRNGPTFSTYVDEFAQMIEYVDPESDAAQGYWHDEVCADLVRELEKTATLLRRLASAGDLSTEDAHMTETIQFLNGNAKRRVRSSRFRGDYVLFGLADIVLDVNETLLVEMRNNASRNAFPNPATNAGAALLMAHGTGVRNLVYRTSESARRVLLRTARPHAEEWLRSTLIGRDDANAKATPAKELSRLLEERFRTESEALLRSLSAGA